MDALKADFIEFMLEAGALRFGDFTTKSGRKTPYFINTGAYVTAAQVQKLGEFYARAIHEAHGDGVENLFGPAYKGIPLAVAAALALRQLYGRNLTYTFNRKEPKDHGEGGGLVGYDYASRPATAGPCRVVLVEDVTTAGTSVRECLPLIQGTGVKAVGLVVSVDRMEKGTGPQSALEEIRAAFGLKTTAIVTLQDLLDYLEARPASAQPAWAGEAGLLERMKAYFREYGAAKADPAG